MMIVMLFAIHYETVCTRIEPARDMAISSCALLLHVH